MSDPIISLPNVMKELTMYCQVSNYKINMGKSEALSINLPVELQKQIRNSFTFKWQEMKFKYLGIQILADLSKLFEFEKFYLERRNQ